MFHIYNPWKHRKTVGFLVFSGGIKWEHWVNFYFWVSIFEQNLSEFLSHCRLFWCQFILFFFFVIPLANSDISGAVHFHRFFLCHSKITYWYIGLIKPHLSFFFSFLPRYKRTWGYLIYFLCAAEVLTHFSPISHFYTPWKRRVEMGSWGFVFTCISFCVDPFLRMTLHN